MKKGSTDLWKQTLWRRVDPAMELIRCLAFHNVKVSITDTSEVRKDEREVKLHLLSWRPRTLNSTAQGGKGNGHAQILLLREDFILSKRVCQKNFRGKPVFPRDRRLASLESGLAVYIKELLSHGAMLTYPLYPKF